jgi:predicted nucleic acid-binding protein
MSETCFVDTNLLVYFRDSSEPEKQLKSAEWMTVLWESRNGRISYQVLNEYYVTVTQKLKPGLNPEDARSDILDLMSWKPIAMDHGILDGAWIVQDRYGYSWWDALIVSSAQRAGCRYLITEDLQHGREIDGVTIVDPFVETPQILARQ